MDSLISPKQPDGFKTESPIRAFTDFQVSGQYAIGKGFRPSMAHLSRYLDAMEAKEGWALVQIILPDNDAADPTILFRKTVLELTSDMAIMPEVVDLTIRKIVIGLGQLRDDMIGQAEARMEDTSVEAKGFLSEAMDQYADRVAGYAAELAALVPVHGAEAIMRQMIAHHGEAVGRAIRKHPALGEPYTPNQHQLADHPVGDVYERFAASIPPMTSAAVAHEAEGPIPTGIYWSGEHANFYDAVTRKGQGQAFMDAWYFRRAEFPTEPNDLGEKTDG